MSFICSYCSHNFSSKAKVKQHILRKVCFKKIHQCMCGKRCASRLALLIHNRRYHSELRQKLETTLLNFNDQMEFESWKTAVEEETVTKFVKPWASYVKKNGSKITRFVCHRSGNARVINNGRKRKRSTSCKINNHCSAHITLEKLLDKSIKVKYYDKHCNHENDINYISMSQKEKKKIVDDLNRGVTFDEILGRSRDKVNDNVYQDTKRTRVLTKKDLQNIMHQYRISFKKNLPNDASSVHRLVEECNERFEENNPVKFFKPQNDVDRDYADGVNPEDMILVIMTSTQKRILMEFGHEQICVDSIHGLQGFEFHLTTIFIINDAGTCLPVAFCMSNSVKENIINIFFSVIMKECGHIRSSVFISEDISMYINTWCKVFGIPGKWQVDKSLRQNIEKLNGPVELNTETDKRLRSLLKEMSDQIFDVLLKNFITILSENEHTKEFGLYFEKEYTSWPLNCLHNYKSHVLIHTNVKIEVMYRVLKDFYFKGLKGRRSDFCVFRLLKMIWDDLFYRLWHLTKENDVYSLKLLGDRHNAALLIPSDFIIEKNQSYQIKSAKDNSKMYSIEKKEINCSCRLKCAECDVCFHVYSCTCIDYSVVENVCQHVHAVSMFEKKATAVQETLDSQNQNSEFSVDRISSAQSHRILDFGPKNGYHPHPNQELIDSLFYMIHSLQTLSYESEDYAQGTDYIRKACDIFCKTGLEKFERNESNKRGQKSRLFCPYTQKKFTSTEINDKELSLQQIQIESVDQSLVDEVEEIVYIDNVDIHYS